MGISVLLVNYNMSRMIQKFLPNIIEQSEAEGEYEIIILDNSDDPEFMLTQEYANTNRNIRLFFADKNEGFVVALNSIIPKARFSKVAIMHPDVELAPGTLQQLQNFLDQNREVGIVGPNFYYPDGVENKIRLKFPTLSSETRRILSIVLAIIARRPLIRSELLWDHKADIQTEMVVSAFLLIRKEVLDQVYPICSKLWTYYTNDFLCSEAGKKGWQSWFLSTARAIHHERYSDESLYSAGKSSEYKRTPLPISDRMDRDRMIFESTRTSYTYWQLLRTLLIAEYLMYVTVALLKGNRNIAQTMMGVIRNVWSVSYSSQR